MTQSTNENGRLIWQVPGGTLDYFLLKANSGCRILLRQYVDDTPPAEVRCSSQSVTEPDCLRDNFVLTSNGTKTRLHIKEEFKGDVTVVLPPNCREIFALLSGGCSLKSEILTFHAMHLRLKDEVRVEAGAAHLLRTTVKAVGLRAYALIGGQDSRLDHVNVLTTHGARVVLKGSFQSLSAKMLDHEIMGFGSHLYVNGLVQDALKVAAEGGGNLHLLQPYPLPPVCEIKIKPGQPYSALS